MMWPATAVAVLALFAAACAPPPSPRPPLRVTTTADTFDGVCDATDCSLRDAIARSNQLPPQAGLPNRIELPAGTVTLSVSEPIEVVQPVFIAGAGRTLTTLDLTGSTVPSPTGVFRASVALGIGQMAVTSSDPTPSDVLVGCLPPAPRDVQVVNVDATGLAALVSGCRTVIAGTAVTGPRTVLFPHTFSASGSTLPFASERIDAVQFNLVNVIATGPTDAEGNTSNATIDLQARDGQVGAPVSISGSRLVGLGLNVGGDEPGGRNLTIALSSLGLTGPDGPVALTLGAGSTGRIEASTVYGGGTGGAIVAAGNLELRSVTATTTGPVLDPAPGATVSARRSILGATVGAACTAPITSLGYNLFVGTSCTTPGPTDGVVGSTAALALDALASHGAAVPSLHRAPLPGSPAIDVIPPGGPADLDCPVAANGQGQSIDGRGVVRPQGSGCDVGSFEVEVTPGG
jgi:CSLREA domain-containing protein